MVPHTRTHKLHGPCQPPAKRAAHGTHSLLQSDIPARRRRASALTDASLPSSAEDAVAYAPESSPFGRRFDHAIPDSIKAKGLSAEDWDGIMQMLRDGFGSTGTSGGFSKAITKANHDNFDKIGCVACYAEYYKGQKAMVV